MVPIEVLGWLKPLSVGEASNPLFPSNVVVLPIEFRYLLSVRKLIGIGIVKGRVHFFTMNFLPLEFDLSLLFLF